MATICYAWDDAPYAWMETPFTWAEGCVIEKVIGGGGAIPSKKIRERLGVLSDDEKEIEVEQEDTEEDSDEESEELST